MFLMVDSLSVVEKNCRQDSKTPLGLKRWYNTRQKRSDPKETRWVFFMQAADREWDISVSYLDLDIFHGGIIFMSKIIERKLNDGEAEDYK